MNTFEVQEEIYTFNEESNVFETEINGIRFVCDEIYEGCEEFTQRLGKCYKENLSSIAEYMLSKRIETYFGKQTIESIIEALGTPQIDVGRYLLTYLEHALDNVHIIEIEFEGILEEFSSMNIDG